MFSYTFNTTNDNIFENKNYPIIKRLFHNYNNPGWTYNYHLHKNDTEIVYIADGQATYTINMQSFHVQKGQLLIIEKGVLHSISSDKNNPVDAWTCLISDYKLKNLCESNKLLNFNTYAILDTGIHDNFIKNLMEEINILCLKESSSTNFTCNLLSASLVSIILDLLPDQDVHTENNTKGFANDILMYISEHYTEKLTLKKISEVFHMSTGHISHSFTNEFGISPINYAIDLRMCEAKLLLLNTNESLTSISNKVGYENTNHFSNIFFKRNNCTPLEFRAQNLNREPDITINRNNNSSGANSSHINNSELMELKKDLNKLKEENEILQKALAILSSKN